MDIKEKIELLVNKQKAHWDNLVEKFGFNEEEDEWKSLLEDWKLAIEDQMYFQIQWIEYVTTSIIENEQQTKRMKDWAKQFKDATVQSARKNEEYWINWIEEMKDLDPSLIIEDKDYDSIINNWQKIIQEAYNSNVNWMKLWKN